jgi:hypothetical protein
MNPFWSAPCCHFTLCNLRPKLHVVSQVLVSYSSPYIMQKLQIQVYCNKRMYIFSNKLLLLIIQSTDVQICMCWIHYNSKPSLYWVLNRWGQGEVSYDVGLIINLFNLKIVILPSNCHRLHDVCCLVIIETLHDRSQHIPGTACNYYHDL